MAMIPAGLGLMGWRLAPSKLPKRRWQGITPGQGLGAALLAYAVLFGVAFHYFHQKENDQISRLGQMGDAFGLLNSLLLALGAFWTIREFHHNRDESIEESKRAEKIANIQNASARIQALEILIQLEKDDISRILDRREELTLIAQRLKDSAAQPLQSIPLGDYFRIILSSETLLQSVTQVAEVQRLKSDLSELMLTLAQRESIMLSGAHISQPAQAAKLAEKSLLILREIFRGLSEVESIKEGVIADYRGQLRNLTVERHD
jgi:hypothetical protein